MIGSSANGASKSYASRAVEASPSTWAASITASNVTSHVLELRVASSPRAWTAPSPRLVDVAGPRLQRGNSGEEGVVRRGHRRIVDELVQHGQQLGAAPLQPPDGHQLGAVPPDGIGVPDLDAELEARVGEPFSVRQPTGPQVHHHLERANDVLDARERRLVEPQTQLTQEPLCSRIAGEKEIDRAPRQPDQGVHDAVRGHRRRDQLVSQLEAGGAVIRPQETVVSERERVGEGHRIA